ncbi:MAG: glycosyltransferase family 2 protein [Candidatus Omnitrophota bacterium]
MLPIIDNHDNHDIFRLSDDYYFVSSPGDETQHRFFLEYAKTQARVETDAIGKKIIDLLPASFGQVIEALTEGDPKTYVSPKLIYYYIAAFWKSGILIKSDVSEERSSTLPSTTTHKVSSKTSVVIVTYYGEAFIRKNLESIYKQTFLPHEVIIVDNASGDRTLEIIRKEYPHVKIIRNPTNVHYARAVNIGVEAATGEWIIILNQDIVLKEDFIEKLNARYAGESNHRLAAAVVPQMRFDKLPGFINGIGNFITEKNWGSDNYFGVVDIGQFDTLKYAGSACFGAVMVTKASWKTVGALDETYRSFYEDVDWSMRAHLAGMKLLAAPEAIAYHAFGGSYPTGLKLKLVVKNRMRFVLKHLKGKTLKKFFIKYLKQDIKSVLFFLKKKSFKNIYYYKLAYWRLLLELPGICANRSKNKSSEEKIRSFFTSGCPHVALGNQALNPVINQHTIRSYYYLTEMEHLDYPPDPIILYS